MLNGDPISANACAALRAHGLIDASGFLSAYGQQVAERAQAIMAGQFTVPSCSLAGIVQYQLQEMDLKAWQHDEQCRAHGLSRSSDIKALRAIVLRPGRAFGTLENDWGYDSLRTLHQAQFIDVDEWRQHDQVFPTEKANAFMAVLAGKFFLIHVGA